MVGYDRSNGAVLDGSDRDTRKNPERMIFLRPRITGSDCLFGITLITSFFRNYFFYGHALFFDHHILHVVNRFHQFQSGSRGNASPRGEVLFNEQARGQ
jgi:hypothetical protein